MKYVPALQARLILRDFSLSDFALMWLENLYHFNKFFGLTRFGLIYLWQEASRSDVTVTPSVTCIDWLHWQYNQVAHLVPWSPALTFVTKISEKRKSTSPTAIQVKNQRKTIGIEKKWDVTSRLEKKVNKLLTYAVMLYLLILAYLQFVIMLIDLQKC